MVCISLRKTCFSRRAETSAGIASSDGYFTKSSYSFLARAGNIVPFLSTCRSTPISNMSAAGAIVTSLYAASDSCLRTMSHEPDCRHIWLIVPVTMKSAPMAYAAAAHAHAHAGLLGDAVALGQDHRQQHRHVPVVGVAAAVALDRDVVAHGHAWGERRLLGSHEPLRQQLRHNVRRRREHRRRRQLGA